MVCGRPTRRVLTRKFWMLDVGCWMEGTTNRFFTTQAQRMHKGTHRISDCGSSEPGMGDETGILYIMQTPYPASADKEILDARCWMEHTTNRFFTT
jgi:hypothetical protein